MRNRNQRSSALRLALAAGFLFASAGAQAGGWSTPAGVVNTVVSSPTLGGGYPDPSGAPVPGTCGLGSFNSNRSESWLAVKPGTDTLVGASKFFFDKFSTFYNFYLGSYAIEGGQVSNNAVQGYDCLTTHTQQMPPSWTNATDPNADFDTQGRVYQTVLPFNAYWTNLHPNGAITISYSDDLGRTWVQGNGLAPLEKSPNESAFSLHFEDKQFIAVNHLPGNKYQDHVYAMWAVFGGNYQVNIRGAVSRDRGLTFAPAATLVPPNVDQPFNTYVYPGIDPKGDVYIGYAAFPPKTNHNVVPSTANLWVARSTDDGVSYGNFSQAATVRAFPFTQLPNTTFRDGITESFAVSQTDPGHLYFAYEDWDGSQFDVYFVQSTDGGTTWSAPIKVNDNVDKAGPTDQFQPTVATGPDGAVAVAFYDRRAPCPHDPSVLPQDRGRVNFCIDVTVQAFKDSGSGAVPVQGNVRASNFSWDPQNPAQHVAGIGQMACVSHSDPCDTSFIGDYFGLAISATNIYTLSVSTHYPSSVIADEGGPVYYQQQVLGTISRSALGL